MYRFSKTIDPSNEYDKTNVSINIPFNDVDLNDLCEAFTDFLKACGFYIEGKHAEIVTDEDVNATMAEDEEPPLTDEDVPPESCMPNIPTDGGEPEPLTEEGV